MEALDCPHLHTRDHGRSLSPCLRKCCNGLDPAAPSSPKSPLIRATKHQIHRLNDPLARPSKVGFTAMPGDKKSGDGDIWVESLCKNKKTGQYRTYFRSTKNSETTCPDEPPTGASHVIYLKMSYVESHIE